MKSLNEKRDIIYNRVNDLKKLKFDPKISQELSFKLSEEEKNLYNKYLFYRNYIKIGDKINGEQICIKER